MAEPEEALIGEDAEIIAEAEIPAEEAVVEVAEEAAEEEAFDAWGYIDGYSDNVTSDENFDENLGKALAVAKEEIPVYATWLSLLPPIIAIALALITKEVYSSLFIGIASGALLYANFNFTGTLDHLFQDGFISSVADSYNIGIIIFLIVLGAIVSLMNKSGGSAAFGRWASTHIKSKVGAQLATIALGVLIFVDDYFNCLTVGSVMRPVSDKFKLSRAKLAYVIDATAAPVCIIAPVSSWAAAVAGFAPEGEGFALFIKAIPWNFYAILTIIMMITIALMKFDFGPMKKHEEAAENGDLFSSADAEMFKALEDADENKKGSVWDLVAPVLVLIVGCIFGLIYSGGFFTADAEGFRNFVVAFSNADASVGLVYGSFGGLIFSVIYFLLRRVLNFKQCMESLPEGFKAMVPAIMILACAWTLKTMTDSLGAKVFIAEFVRNYAGAVVILLPAIVFLIAVGLSFSTGTSWGTFGILIPIVLAIFSGVGAEYAYLEIIAISACMAGAVCGDHCSPISDTTIMASAGSQSNHINHVTTQLPYALTVAAVSFVCYIIAGLVKSAYIALPIGIVLMIGTLFVIKAVTKKKA
ncbi:MAG: Na+/H+ antiporter NhaC family protein [Clostridia bacterium]|nr:Na+/H+ antiporter NhaC family protein [Clostridia bacterium]